MGLGATAYAYKKYQDKFNDRKKRERYSIARRYYKSDTEEGTHPDAGIEVEDRRVSGPNQPGGQTAGPLVTDYLFFRSVDLLFAIDKVIHGDNVLCAARGRHR